jgi:pyruvate formate lyase activating enzyme
VETCGFAPLDIIKRIAPLVDTFLYDWKESDNGRHREFTGVDNGQILANLEYLCENGADVVLRLPFIPEYNATDSHIDGVISLANRLKKLKRIDIMPYHPLGTSKDKELGRDSVGRIEPEIPSKQLLEEVAEKLHSGTGMEVNICI